jgi:hypothetical protein
MDKKLKDLNARLRAEAEEFEEGALKALQTGKRSARIQFTFASRDQAIVAVCDPSKGPYLETMPTGKARGYVKIVNDAHKHLDAILDAYRDDDQGRALQYIRELFRTIRTARRVGRPELPEGETSEERVTRYLEAHDLDATMRQFPHLKPATILQYQANVIRKRSR